MPLRSKPGARKLLRYPEKTGSRRKLGRFGKQCHPGVYNSKHCHRHENNSKQCHRLQINSKQCHRLQINSKQCHRLQINSKKCHRHQINSKQCHRILINSKQCHRLEINSKQCHRLPWCNSSWMICMAAAWPPVRREDVDRCQRIRIHRAAGTSDVLIGDFGG